MTLIVKKDISKQLKAIANQQKDTIKFSVLIGFLDAQENKVSILSAIHFTKNLESVDNLTVDQNDVNQLTSLKYILGSSL